MTQESIQEKLKQITEPMDEEKIIRVEHLTKLYYGKKDEAYKLLENGASKQEVYEKTGTRVALWDVSLEIPEGKIYVIIGLSGSGKSTLVRCLNYLNKPTSGDVYYMDKNLKDLDKKELLEYRRNNISMVFQSFGLMSHRDVMGNVEYGLEIKGVPKEERQKKAQEVIDLVGLTGWEHQACESLSGGMRQRVGIARALANDPEVLLLDEPFSALDPLVRKDMQLELLKIQRKLKKTIVFITHDIDEAFFLGDTIAIMRDAKVIQIDTPAEMSKNPADAYVEAFIHSADKARVLQVKDAMQPSTSIARLNSSMDNIIHTMSANGVSTLYVVDDQLNPVGIINIHDAIRGRREGLNVVDVMSEDIMFADPEALLSDVMEASAMSPYPLAVVDASGQLSGILTKSSVLSSLA
jgi:glycine betaine/proline transport system ATP-binding protein